MMRKIYILIFLFFMVACYRNNDHQEVWIQNPLNQSIYLNVDGLKNSSYRKLAIIQHGLASDMKHNVVQTAKKAFLDDNYVVITFDSRYSLGEGNNEVEKARLRTFAQDLETVAEWAKTQSFYSEPFALSGHSLGGASVIKFGAKYPQKVSILIPVAPVISGELWEKSCMENLSDFCSSWKESGNYEYIDEISRKKANISFAVVSDTDNYDAKILAPVIKAKTLIIGAENDVLINRGDLYELSENIQDGRLVVVEGAEHNFKTERNQIDLYNIIETFLQNK